MWYNKEKDKDDLDEDERLVLRTSEERKMPKYWIVLEKFAGMEVEAESPEEAQTVAEEANESEYEFGFEQNQWVVTNVEEIED